MAEDVFVKYGHYEILPTRMEKYIGQQEIDEGERARIVKARNIHLDWYHRHFAYAILPPPGGEWEPRA